MLPSRSRASPVKKLPQGLWRDTFVDKECQVIYYDSRSRSYRVEYPEMGSARLWAAVDAFGEGKRFEPLGRWGFLLQQKFDLRAG